MYTSKETILDIETTMMLPMGESISVYNDFRGKESYWVHSVS